MKYNACEIYTKKLLMLTETNLDHNFFQNRIFFEFWIYREYI